ncbi:MAG: hypothetical protein JXO48_10935 [Deltaproteobacteria bacterium]|nr:hypothetical protein [Deltaproteobacteria bacterium]
MMKKRHRAALRIALALALSAVLFMCPGCGKKADPICAGAGHRFQADTVKTFTAGESAVPCRPVQETLSPNESRDREG